MLLDRVDTAAAWVAAALILAIGVAGLLLGRE
jgi:hypothetical protein